MKHSTNSPKRVNSDFIDNLQVNQQVYILVMRTEANMEIYIRHAGVASVIEIEGQGSERKIYIDKIPEIPLSVLNLQDEYTLDDGAYRTVFYETLEGAEAGYKEFVANRPKRFNEATIKLAPFTA